MKYNIISITYKLLLGLRITTLIYSIEDKEYSHKFPPNEFTYDNIVDYVISLEYPNDKMLAIINNYLIGVDKEEFDKMLEFRVLAKLLAKEALNYDN